MKDHCLKSFEPYKPYLTSPWKLSLVTLQYHKILKKLLSLILQPWGSFCIWWQFSQSSGVAMATFCYECFVQWKSEETCIFGMILAWSWSNLVHGGIFGSWIQNHRIKILVWRPLTSKWLSYIAYGNCVKIPIHRLWKLPMASLWRHFLSNIFETSI